MLTEKDHPEHWLQLYQVQDLTRSLIRQYLLQNKLSQTLDSLQSQDRRSYKKISKSVLVKILSMNNLIYFNKQAQKPYSSMLEVLVGYLRDKFRMKVELSGHNGKSEGFGLENSLKESSEQGLKVERSLNSTVKLENARENNLVNSKVSQQGKNKRPMTSGSRINSRNVQNIYAELEKQDIKEKEKKIAFEKQKEEEKRKQKEELERRRKQQEEKERVKQLQIQKEKEKQRQKERQRKQLEIQREKQARAAEQKKKAQQKQLVRKKQQEQRLKKLKQQEEKKKQEEKKRKEAEEQQKLKEEEQKRLKQQEQKAKNQRIQSQESKQELSQKQNPRMGGMRKPLKKKQSEPQTDLKIENTPIVEDVKQEAPFVLQPQVEKASAAENKIQSSKKEEAPKMVTIFGKKKKNNEPAEQNEPRKFKFDENFVDQPLYSQGEKYNYEKIEFNKITVKAPAQPEVNYREKPIVGNKKYVEKPITQQQAQQLKKAVFQSGSPVLPKSWYQGFILSPHAATPYGLQQIEGGPCGIIAAIQCYFLKHFLHLSKPSIEEMSNQSLRENCLVAAIADMLYKSRNSDKITLALPPKSFSGTKLDISTFRIITIEASTFAQAYEGLYQHKSYFIGKTNHGVAVLMYCNVMTKGIQNIWNDMDMPDNPLIGHHGHCTQQLVNLFITGKASSNIFDGITNLDEITLKGITQKSQFGFLTIYQTNDQLHVGKNLKNPLYPFWIICKEFHYHVIFANHYLIAQNNNAAKFDIVYFDGLYNCADRIVITLQGYGFGEEEEKEKVKVKDLPLIQQVMKTKWGLRKADWNGSIKIL